MAAKIPSETIRMCDIPWKPGNLPGQFQKLVWNDSATKRNVSLYQFPADFSSPMHQHNGDELVYVIEGEWGDQFGVVTAGNFGYRPQGCVHKLYSKGGATIISFLTGDTCLADATPTTPRSQIINTNEMVWAPDGPVMAKKFWQDPNSERRAQMARLPAGDALPVHRHVGEEMVYVIEGSIRDEHAETEAGNMSWRPTGCTHSVGSRHGAVCFAFIWGHTVPV